MPELIERAEWLVLSTPLTAETRGMIGAPELSRMRKDAVLINLGRGPLIDEPALIDALERGVIAGASLDVFDREPLPADHPLWAFPQVILTPHISGLGDRLWERATDLFARNLTAFREGRPLENLVDKRAATDGSVGRSAGRRAGPPPWTRCAQSAGVRGRQDPVRPQRWRP
jgi:phosphoglycerate dehydrogenase-like enzyme